MRASIMASTAILAGFFAHGEAQAQSTLALTTTSGRPNAIVGFHGGSFGDGEAVDIYVDTVDTLLLVSSSTGTFSNSVSLPKTTQPGPHYITAIGRRSGDAAQASFTVTTPWSELGFGAAHHSWNPFENTLDAGAVASLGPLYAVSTGAGSSSPVVANGRIYVGSPSGSGIQSLSTASARVYWKAEAASAFDTTPAVADDIVYIGSEQAMMYALNATSGKQYWATAGGSGFDSSPVVSGGNVYVGCDDGKLYAFEAKTTGQTAGGKILWTYTTGSGVVSSPAVFNNVVYVGSGDSKVYALTSAGALVWSYATGASVYSSPAVVNGLVYVGSADSKLYAIKADNGALVWSAKTGGVIQSSPAVAYGLVYVGSDDGNLYAYNAHTGALQWSVNFGAPFDFASPSVADGVVYAASTEGTLYAIQAITGNILWTYATAGDGSGSPAISDGTLYFNSIDGETYAFATEAGTDALRRRAHAPAISTLRLDPHLRVSD
jgi:outer membrane protein assembly factor BamB